MWKLSPRMRPHHRRVGLLLLAHAVMAALADDCVFHHVDRGGELWTWNISALTQPHDYEVDLPQSDLGSGTRSYHRIALNVCRPPISACNPASGPKPSRRTPTALLFLAGSAPAGSQQCGSAPCTPECSQLGYGALGHAGAHWSLIDPAVPIEGVRIVHYGLEPAQPASQAQGSGRDETSSLDEWGAPRPPTFTLDLVCDFAAPLPAAPLERIALLGQSHADVALRMRTRAACPTKSAICVHVAPDASHEAASTTHPASGGRDEASAGSADRSTLGAKGVGGPHNPWLFALSILSALAILTLLMLGLVPLSLRRSLRKSYTWAAGRAAGSTEEIYEHDEQLPLEP